MNIDDIPDVDLRIVDYIIPREYKKKDKKNKNVEHIHNYHRYNINHEPLSYPHPINHSLYIKGPQYVEETDYNSDILSDFTTVRGC